MAKQYFDMPDDNTNAVIDWKTDPYKAKPVDQPLEKPKMSPSTFTIQTITTTYINGKDASSFSDVEIFEMIYKLESHIRDLERIENKPYKLDAAIKNVTNTIVALCTYVDGRGAA